MKKFPLVKILLFILISKYSYSQFKIIPTNNPQTAIGYISKIGRNILIGGNKNFLVKCYDNCDTLISLNPPGQFNNNNAPVTRSDTNTIYICSNNFSSFNGKLFKSNDGGLTWESIYEIDSGFFLSIAMIQNEHGLIGSDFGNFFTTTDGGSNWQLSSGWGSATFNIAESFGDSLLFLSGNGFVQKSSNFFETWQSGYFDFYEPGGLNILNSDTLLICATGNAQNNKSMMSYSINGGLDWTIIEYSTGIYFNDIFFKNKNEGYIVGYKFLGVNKGIILKTTDFGQSFTEIITPYNVEFTKIEFINDSIALLGGTNGLLVQWNTKIPITTSVEKLESQTSSFSVYPNPVINNLTIENNFSILPIQQIILQNSLGVNVSFFNNFIHNHNKINLDISFLPSGLYFIKIKDHNGTETTQKFIKLN